MKSLAAVFLLLLLLTGCAEHATPAQELEPAHTHPAETQDAEAPEAVETPEDPVTPEAPETPEAADYGDAAFCGGITLFAGDPVALINSEEVTMEGAPFFEEGEFYVPLRFAAETLGWHYAEDGDTITLSATKTWEWGVDFAPDGGYSLRPCDPVTQELELTVGERAFTLNGEAVESCSAGVPVRRDSVIYLPLDFLTFSDGDGQQSVPWLFGGSTYDPEAGYAILNGQRNEAGLGKLCRLAELGRVCRRCSGQGFAESGMLGQSSIGEYNVVEYMRGGLRVHVLRPMTDGTEVFPATRRRRDRRRVYARPQHRNPTRIAGPAMRAEKAEQVYDGSFADTLSLRLDQQALPQHCGARTPFAVLRHPARGLPQDGANSTCSMTGWRIRRMRPETNWNPVTKALDD